MSESPHTVAGMDIRELLRDYLPQARADYVRTWKALSNASTVPSKRREIREQALAKADSHASFCEQIENNEAQYSGDDLRNLRVLDEQLRRLETGLRDMTKLSPHALLNSAKVSPAAVGCGKHIKIEAQVDQASGSRAVRLRPEPRDSRGRSSRQS